MFWQVVDLISPLLGLALIPGAFLGSRNRSALLALVVSGAVIGHYYNLTVYPPVVDIAGVPAVHVALMSFSWYDMFCFATGAALGMLGGAIAHWYEKLSPGGA